MTRGTSGTSIGTNHNSSGSHSAILASALFLITTWVPLDLAAKATLTGRPIPIMATPPSIPAPPARVKDEWDDQSHQWDLFSLNTGGTGQGNGLSRQPSARSAQTSSQRVPAIPDLVTATVDLVTATAVRAMA